MNYKIQIKHNLPEAKVLTVGLCYIDPNASTYDPNKSDEENSLFPVIFVNVTNEEQIVHLTGWDPSAINEEGIDVNKIKLSQTEFEDAEEDKIYKIEELKINLSDPTAKASQDVMEDEVNIPISYEDEDPNSIQRQIINEFDRSYTTGGYDTSIGSLICSDTSKFLYTNAKDIEKLIDRGYLTQAEFNDTYGINKLQGAFLAVKKDGTSEVSNKRISYTSIYFNNTLIEANSQYARFEVYEKTSISSQSINEEGCKNGVACYGKLDRAYRLCDINVKVPLKNDGIVNLYTGDDADILYISFAYAYSPASTSYKPVVGDIYVDGTKIARGSFVRVSLKKGQEYVITASNLSSNGGRTSNSNLKTLGGHKVTLPLYSDNILKIVVYDETESHFDDDLSLQARANLWGLPRTMFVGPLPNNEKWRLPSE